MENPYSRAPLQATLYDVSAGAPVRSYMFLGDIPQNVFNAARRGRAEGWHEGRINLAGRMTGAHSKVQSSAWPEATWSQADATTLQRYYGSRWRWLLTPRVGAVAGLSCAGKPPPPTVGGRETYVDFGNLDDFDDADIIIEEEDLGAVIGPPDPDEGPPTPQTPAPAGAEEEGLDWDPQTVYVREAAYPEDTFADLKAKIHSATGVPLYRQHLFYAPGEDDEETSGYPVRTTYRVTVEGALILTDIRRFAQELCPDIGSSDLVAEIPVDSRLEERKEDVRIDALDTFRTLEESPGVYIRRVFVADLATLLRPRVAQVQKALRDRYQFDLLYYGMVLKYWPALSPEAFRLAVSDPGAIRAAFPLLSPPIEKVRSRLALERRLIDQMYTRTKAQMARLTREKNQGGLAVTEASVTVEPRAAKTPINVRNILDWVPATRLLPAVLARVPAEVLGETGRAGARVDHIIEKTHVSVSAQAGALGRFFAHPPKRSGVSYAIVRKTASTHGRAFSAQPRFVYLTVYDDGRYLIESSWREDDRVNFDDVVEQLSAAALPVIELINGMGAAALPLGGRLETPAEASRGVNSRAAIRSLTVSSFWPHALTTDGFRDLKTRWREYERAGIVGIRGLQQAGAYTFMFRKGVTKYDPRAMERVVSRAGGIAQAVSATHRQVVTNHYAHLTDPATAQRWQYVYSGRLVRVYHRTTDLRIEIVDVSMEEFRRIRLYVFVYLDGLLHGPDCLTKGIVLPGQSRPVEGRLRGLQERDPDLYDLKKYDEGATVYSVLCQGDRQPEILTEEEAAAARGAKKIGKPNLVKFWNFTEGRPAYYRCPSERFPHLSFRVGEHPLGYCIPCCKKTQALSGSKAQSINRLCLLKHQTTEEDIEGVIGDDPMVVSRHVLSYGKAVPVGRISLLPRLLSDGLFYNSLPRPFVYRLVGVPQQTPPLSEAGYFFAVASSLSLEGPALARELADTAIALQETYRSLACGGAAVFISAEDLAEAIVSSFATFSEGAPFSPFGPGGAAAASWRAIVADLVRIRFDVEVVTFVDEAGDGDAHLEASAAAASRLRSSGDVETDAILLVAHPSGTYPLVAMDQKEFLRHAYGRGPARRFFSSSYDEEDIGDRVVEILRDMAGRADSKVAACGGARGAFDLSFVTDVCRSAGHRVLYRMINLRDMCYGVVVAPRWAPEGWVYFPVPYSPHTLPPPSDGAPAPTALYGPRPEGAYPAASLAKILDEMNAAVSGPRAGRSQLRPGARLVDPEGQTVGFIADTICGPAKIAAFRAGIFFHHDPVGAESGIPWAAAPKATIPYSMRAIDRAIYEAGGAPQRPPLPADKFVLAERGLYRYQLYRLFVAEFAALLQDERNEPVRTEMKELFKKTRFSSPASLTDFRQTLGGILQEYPEDINTVRSMVATAYARVGPAALRKALEDSFDATAFDFDRRTLNRLRALGARPAVEQELGRIMRARVELDDDAAHHAAGRGAEGQSILNMYVACSLPSDVSRPQCVRARLRMTPERFAPYVSILAADILNPLKSTTLGTLTSGVVDGARFVMRPGERIHIR